VQQRTRVFFETSRRRTSPSSTRMHLSVVAPLQAPGYVNVEVRNPTPQRYPDGRGPLPSVRPLAVDAGVLHFATSSVARLRRPSPSR